MATIPSLSDAVLIYYWSVEWSAYGIDSIITRCSVNILLECWMVCIWQRFHHYQMQCSFITGVLSGPHMALIMSLPDTVFIHCWSVDWSTYGIVSIITRCSVNSLLECWVVRIWHWFHHYQIQCSLIAGVLSGPHMAMIPSLPDAVLIHYWSVE